LKIANAGYDIITKIDEIEIMKFIEKIGRTCYKSEDKITVHSSTDFIKKIIDRKHDAILEFFDITVKFYCDRGISHEVVRHRIASYAQESTRYCNYNKDKFNKEITVIYPIFWTEDSEYYKVWKDACEYAEKAYLKLIELGAKAEQARSVLPTSLKTELNVKMNLREWRHFFTLRTTQMAHPQMREISIPLLIDFKQLIPIIFDDIEIKQENI
jgi:thymidylate synthase (FAD)